MALRVHSKLSGHGGGKAHSSSRRLKRPLPRATIEVRLVPKKATPGFLWSYVWTIELSGGQATSLFELLHHRRGSRSASKAAVRRIAIAASRRGLPFGPGSLADYDLVEEETVVRFDLGSLQTRAR
ncbi:MAG: hypothetical protein ABI771_16165 [Betaproteobacteria bacterium]